ncbi:dihydrodipicolinate synthase family protein [Caproiciproducens sp.]
MGKYQITDIKGVIPATMTFFDKDENIDEKRTRGIIEFLLGAGVDGLYLTGSTGECFTMSLEERKQVVEIVMDQVKGRVPVIVHVGDIGTKKSIELAKHAEAVGVDAISSVPPFYWNFSPDNIYHYYEDIARSTSLPMIVYNIQLAGIMDKNMLLRIAEIENVKGLKYTARSHDELGSLKSILGKDFMIYSGCDEMAFSGLCFGADGIIGSFYNVIPELYKSIYECVKKSDIPGGIRLQKIADELIFAALQYDLPSIIYVLMRWRGLDAGYSRRPFQNYQDDEMAEMKQAVKDIREKYHAEELNIFKV